MKHPHATVRANHCTQARKTLRCRLSHCWRQLLSRVERSAQHLHAHSNSKHAKLSARTLPAPVRVESDGTRQQTQTTHARTHHSSSSPQTPVAAASEPGRTAIASPARRHTQQTCQFERLNASCTSTRLKATGPASKRRQRTHARTARRHRLRHRWRQLLSRPKRPSDYLYAHSTRETAWRGVR